MLNNDYSELQAKHNKLMIEFDSLNERFNILNDQLDMRNNDDREDAKILDLTKQLLDKEEEIAALKTKIEILKGEKVELEEKKVELHEINEINDVKISSLQSEKNTMENILRTEIADLKDQIRNYNSILELADELYDNSEKIDSELKSIVKEQSISIVTSKLNICVTQIYISLINS